jgi:hypothetical protein
MGPGGLWSLFWLLGQEKNILTLPGIEPRFLGFPAYSLVTLSTADDSSNDIIFFHGTTTHSGPGLHYWGFAIAPRDTILDKTPLDKESALRRDLYLTTHNTDKRQTSMPPAELEPAIPASGRLQTNALNCAATGIFDNTIFRVVKVITKSSRVGKGRGDFRRCAAGARWQRSRPLVQMYVAGF